MEELRKFSNNLYMYIYFFLFKPLNLLVMFDIYNKNIKSYPGIGNMKESNNIQDVRDLM